MPDEMKLPRLDEIRELQEMTAASDSRDYLHAAARQAKAQYDDYELIVDVDAHLQEGRFWDELIEFMDSDVLQYTARNQLAGGIRAPLINMQPGMSFQALAGRVPHQSGPGEKVDDPATHGHPFAQIMLRFSQQ